MNAEQVARNDATYRAANERIKSVFPSPTVVLSIVTRTGTPSCRTNDTAAVRHASFVFDRSVRAIESARAKAAERGVDARFVVADARRLEELNAQFDTVIDSGLFHVFDDADRPVYVASLERVVVPGGRCLLMCFSEHQPGDFGPRRVTQEELRAAFSGGWEVRSIEAASFETRDGLGAQAWLAMLDRR